MKIPGYFLQIWVTLYALTLLYKECSASLSVQHSYVVKVNFNPTKDGEKTIRCTGAIYNGNWIITSARCALYAWRRKRGNPTHDYGDIGYGDNPLVTECKPEDVGRARWVIDVALPPGLNDTIEGTPAQDKDIAMLKMQKPLDLGKQMKAIRIPENAKECAPNVAYFFGWGVSGGEDYGTDLHRIDMDVLADQECKESIPGIDLTSRMCLRGAKDSKSAKETSAKADTGGPLVKMTEIKLKQAPVATKFPFLCGVLPIASGDRTDLVQGNVVEYFSAVLKHVSWIKKVGGKQNGI